MLLYCVPVSIGAVRAVGQYAHVAQSTHRLRVTCKACTFTGAKITEKIESYNPLF